MRPNTGFGWTFSGSLVWHGHSCPCGGKKPVVRPDKNVRPTEPPMASPEKVPGLALFRWSEDVRQLGVAARQLSPPDPCAREILIGPAPSFEGRCGSLEPDEAEVS